MFVTEGGILQEHGPGSTFLVMHGPDRLPSVALAELQETGYTVMPSLIAPRTIAALRRNFSLDADADAGPMDASPPGGPNAAPEVLKCQVNPIIVYLLHAYLRDEELRLGGGPALATLHPQQNIDAAGGWHSDFPYSGHHIFAREYPEVPQGRFPDPEEVILGLQYNVCIDAFTEENGGTMFALGSALENRGPPQEWSDLKFADVPGGDGSNTGPGRQAQQLQGPPGTVILYDARTWCDITLFPALLAAELLQQTLTAASAACSSYSNANTY